MPPIRPRRLALVGRLAVVLLLVSARSSDDGTDVRSSSGSASAGSGSSSGLAAEDLSGGTDDPLIQTGVASYRDYVLAEVAQLRVDTKAFTDAVRAGDLEAAKAAYAPSRATGSASSRSPA